MVFEKKEKRNKREELIEAFKKAATFQDDDIDNDIQSTITKIFIALHVSIFVQAVGFFIQNTSFPYLTKSLGVTPQVYGYIISVNAIMQLFGGPVCGYFSDIYGGRFTLVISFFVLSISYTILGLANSITLLFVAKIPRFASHPLQSMYLIISDITYQEGRADMMGKLGVSSGLGMIVGSAIGGVVTSAFGNRSAFFVATAITACCIVIAIALIPSDTTYIRRHLDMIRSKKDNEGKTETPKVTKEKESNPQKSSFLGYKQLIEVTKTKHMLYLLTLKVITGFPFGVLGAMFTLVIMEYYHLEAKQNGMVLSYLGIVGMITQGYLIGLFCRYLNDGILILISTILMAIGFLFLITAESIYTFCATCIPLTVGGSLIHIVITAIITKVVHKDQTGSALGVTLCTHSTCRAIAPTVGGYLFQHVGFFSFGVVGYIANFTVTLYLIFFGRYEFNTQNT